MRPEARDEIKGYEEEKSLRSPLENDWRMASAFCAPRTFSTWNVSGPPTPQSMATARRYAYDSTGVNALAKYVAILNRIATPESQRWMKLVAAETSLMKNHAVRVFFDQLNDKLFKMRYAPRARFQQGVGEMYKQIGLYGVGPISYTWRKRTPLDTEGGFGYKAWPLRDVFLIVDDGGVVVGSYRRFFMNARQFKAKFGADDAPPCVKAELAKATPSETEFFEFVHVLKERSSDDHDPEAIDARRHPVSSNYICVKDAVYVGEEQGFSTMPLLTPRAASDANEKYGYSAALQALPALGGVNAIKKTVLKQGQKAVEPAFIAADDGVLSGRVDQRPGKINYGGVNSQGQKLVHRLETGDFRVAEKLVEAERSDIEESFLVTVFRALVENPQMTATQAMQVVADQASQLAPQMGRLQSEFLGLGTEREIAMLAENGQLPEMPPELQEAGGRYQVMYTSPLAKGQYAEDVQGYMRLQEILMAKAQASGDPSVLDWLNDDAAIPEIADFMSVRTSWINTTQVVEMKRKQRDDKMLQEQLIKQAPAAASVLNSATKNGGQVPGVSGG